MNEFSGALHTAERLRLALKDSLLQRNRIAASLQKTSALIDDFNTELRTVVSTGAVASLDEARLRLAASAERRTWPMALPTNRDQRTPRGAVDEYEVLEMATESALPFEVCGPSPFVSS